MATSTISPHRVVIVGAGFGGLETTYRSSSNLLSLLLTHPDQLEAVQQDRALIPAVIEEGLRPWRFAPVRMDADSVLELPPHTVFNSGTRLGDRFEMRLKTAKATNGACTKDPQAVA